jgi:hypothetical protein
MDNESIMDTEIVYPELPPGYVWRERGAQVEGVVGAEDADVLREEKGDYLERLVAYVASVPDKNDDAVVYARMTHSNLYFKMRFVPTFQDGVYLLAALIWMGEIQ